MSTDYVRATSTTKIVITDRDDGGIDFIASGAWLKLSDNEAYHLAMDLLKACGNMCVDCQDLDTEDILISRNGVKKCEYHWDYTDDSLDDGTTCLVCLDAERDGDDGMCSDCRNSD